MKHQNCRTHWLCLIVFALSTSVFQVRDSLAVEYDRASDHHSFTVFMKEGGWCWYQDPRAIIHDDKLIMGAVQGNGSGPALVGVYDLRLRQKLETAVMQDNFMRDDHNSPVLYARPDGSILSMYALHGRNKTHYYQISGTKIPIKWGKELSYQHDYTNAGTVTYMNLYPVSKQGKLYNFFRGIQYNPSFITSTDHGETWGEPTHFIQDEVAGLHRPYARYAGDGFDTIHVCFTEAHPRVFGNSIYYAAFRGGQFFRANGQPIKNLRKEGPLKPSEAELIFRGSGQQVEGQPGRSAPRSAWTSCLALDAEGRPHIGYTLYLSNSDHRYRIASWDGNQWIDREVAFAGNCLYQQESSYTGLITLDPVSPNTVLISTDVDPATGKKIGSNHEIYRAEIGLEDDIRSFQWKAITCDSPVRNLRPVIVRGDGYRVFAWLRGEFNSFTDYQLDVVGIAETLE